MRRVWRRTRPCQCACKCVATCPGLPRCRSHCCSCGHRNCLSTSRSFHRSFLRAFGVATMGLCNASECGRGKDVNNLLFGDVCACRRTAAARTRTIDPAARQAFNYHDGTRAKGDGVCCCRRLGGRPHAPFWPIVPRRGHRRRRACSRWRWCARTVAIPVAAPVTPLGAAGAACAAVVAAGRALHAAAVENVIIPSLGRGGIARVCSALASPIPSLQHRARLALLQDGEHFLPARARGAPPAASDVAAGFRWRAGLIGCPGVFPPRLCVAIRHVQLLVFEVVRWRGAVGAFRESEHKRWVGVCGL